MPHPAEPALAATSTVADETSVAPAGSLNTALNVATIPLPELGVRDVFVIEAAGTVHEPICCEALAAPPDPVAETETPFVPLNAALNVRGSVSVTLLPLSTARAVVASTVHCVGSAATNCPVDRVHVTTQVPTAVVIPEGVMDSVADA